MIINYDIRILLDMAQEHLNAENEYRLFLTTYKGGYVRHMDPEIYGDYCHKEAKSTCTYDALRSACKVVFADMDKVIATAKAMNRFEKRERWQVCAHIGWRDEDNIRRFFSEDDGLQNYFHSTGRPKP